MLPASREIKKIKKERVELRLLHSTWPDASPQSDLHLLRAHREFALSVCGRDGVGGASMRMRTVLL
jgi:hypothetical protein